MSDEEIKIIFIYCDEEITSKNVIDHEQPNILDVTSVIWPYRAGVCV